MHESINTSVLVIDDEEMIRDNIEDILVPKKLHRADNESMDLATSILFDSSLPVMPERSSRTIPAFKVDKAANGIEGLKMVKRAIEEGNPYAVIFLDMRMPGWDGVETAVHIRQWESKAEIIFVTAYSDRSIEEIVEKAGQNVSYHCKPYATEEIVQIASKAVNDYNKLRNLEKLIETISSLSLNETQLLTLLRNILDQLAISIQAETALLGKVHDDYTYEQIFAIGTQETKMNVNHLINKMRVADLAPNEVVQMDEVVLVRMDNYTIFAALKTGESLKTEKMYLLKLFVQNAARAIRNAELTEKLLQKEKLSAVGNAIGMVMHDLRSPIKNISVFTSILREEGISNDLVDGIDECAWQASRVFDDFLDFIRETPVKKQSISLEKIITESLKMAAAKNTLGSVRIEKNIPPNVFVPCDESKLERTIMNIVNNAAEALIDNNTADPAISITAQLAANGEQILIKVHDNGPGIHDTIIKTLFEPFVTKNKANGTGLGLAIVKQYITAHGGSITVENNNGAVFTIKLPLL